MYVGLTWEGIPEVARFHVGDDRTLFQTIIVVAYPINGLISRLSKSVACAEMEVNACHFSREKALLTVQYPLSESAVVCRCVVMSIYHVTIKVKYVQKFHYSRTQESDKLAACMDNHHLKA